MKKILFIGSGYIYENFISKYKKKYNVSLISRNKQHQNRVGFFYDETFINECFDCVVFAATSMASNKKDFDKFIYQAKKIIDHFSNQPQPQKIIFLSSCAVYGTDDHSIKNENSPLKNNNLYRKEKLVIEDYLSKANKEKLNFISLRISNPWGKLPKTISGNGIVNKILHSSRNVKIRINNNGNSLRDFIHIIDIIDCVDFFINKNLPNEELNLSFGESFSLRSVIEQMPEEFKKKISYVDEDYVDSSIISNRKLRSNFSFLPKYNITKVLSQDLSI